MRLTFAILLLLEFFNTSCQEVSGKWTGKLWSSNINNTDTCKIILVIDSKSNPTILAQLTCYLNDDVYTVISASGSFDKQQNSISLFEQKLIKKKMPDNWVVYFLEYNLHFTDKTNTELKGKAKCISSSDKEIECTDEVFEIQLQKKG